MYDFMSLVNAPQSTDMVVRRLLNFASTPFFRFALNSSVE